MAGERVQSVDILRGAVMIVMALDHVRDFVNFAAQHFVPEDLARTTAVIFFTRWITHFCAPVFMFLAGTGAFFWVQRRGRTTNDLARLLLTRGLWLIFLELTVIHVSFYFNWTYRIVPLITFWALGWSMIALAAQVRFPYRILLGLSLAIIALHNLLDAFSARQFGEFAWLWEFLHQQGVLPIGSDHLIVFGYPVIPWISVMAAGYCFGRVFLMDATARQKLLVRLGAALTAAFVVLRAVNIYGDPVRWSQQKSAMFTVLSFLNCRKYPPSLDFLLMTLGPAILILGLIENVRLRDHNPLLVFGRVPLFYFVIHIPLIHAIAMLLALIRYGHVGFMFDLPKATGGNAAYPADYGYSLGATYAIWAALVVLLYFPCRWYAELKRTRTDWWLTYL
jgi:uncharacterized membrane protein